MKPIRLASLVVMAITIASCSSDAASPTDSGSTSSIAVVTTTTASAVTSTTVPVTTSTSTSTTTSTTSTTSSTTTTTVAPGAELVLRNNGLGAAAFGADPDGVVAYVSAIIGPATVDSGWINPLEFGSCPGTEFRHVLWGDLDLQFGDESIVASGRRHFFSYTYGPPLAGPTAPIAPAGLKTEAGIAVGATVAELTGTYPTVAVNPADDFGGANFLIDEGLAGFLTGVTPEDTVTSILGGQGCGE